MTSILQTCLNLKELGDKQLELSKEIELSDDDKVLLSGLDNILRRKHESI